MVEQHDPARTDQGDRAGIGERKVAHPALDTASPVVHDMQTNRPVLEAWANWPR